MSSEFDKLLKRTARAAAKHFDLQQELNDEFIKRYGVTYSDVDADELIDILDMGGGTISEKFVDRVMKDAMARRPMKI